MNILAERLIGESTAVAQVKNIISCSNCQKQAIRNLYYCQPCHKGVYCQECISFCSKCCQVQGEAVQGLGELLKGITVKCVNSIHGCTSVLAMDAISAHEKQCTFGSKEKPISFSLNMGNINKCFNEFSKINKFLPQKGTETSLGVTPLQNSESALQSKLLMLEKRIETIEANKASSDFKFVCLRQELLQKVETAQKLIESTFKQFMESKIFTRIYSR